MSDLLPPSFRSRPTASGSRLAVMFAAFVAVLSTSCAAAPIVPKCARIDVPSMGPENEFRVSIPAESASTVRDPRDRIDIALTMLAPIVGPVVLVQAIRGKEAAHWQLNVSTSTGISTRCRIGSTPLLSTCDATLGNLPLSTAGEWSIDPGANHVLEAGLSFRTCR